MRAGYRFVIDHYEPGDFVFLISFSRDAYTVPRVANPTVQASWGTGIDCGFLHFRMMSRDVVRKVVDTVLEHGAGHLRRDAVDKRHELARHFQSPSDSVDPDGHGKSNGEPYLIA